MLTTFPEPGSYVKSARPSLVLSYYNHTSDYEALILLFIDLHLDTSSSRET